MKKCDRCKNKERLWHHKKCRECYKHKGFPKITINFKEKTKK